MHGVVHIAPPHWVGVHVLQLLSHHLLVLDLLRMTPFLPELICLVDLVSQFEKSSLLQQGREPALCKFINDPPRCIGLEPANAFEQTFRYSNLVQVILEDHVAKYTHLPLPLQKAP